MTARRFLFSLAFLLVSVFSASGQQLPPPEPLMPEEYQPEEFPQWTHDLRRFEIISIGSFPITFFATSLIYDFSYYAASGFNPAYSLGTQRSSTDIGIIIGVAAGLSLTIGIIDLIININKRNKAEEEEDEQRRVSGSDP